jgi:hypothetical protein
MRLQGRFISRQHILDAVDTRSSSLIQRISTCRVRGDGKEKRKIPVISLQATDLPIKRDNIFCGYSESFPEAFLA